MSKSKLISKKTLFASGISLVLCMAMLVGTTFAWFSDTVSNKGNQITAGNLKLDVSYSDNLNGTYTDFVTGGAMIDQANWQPSDNFVKYIKITNTGSINGKASVNFINNGVAAGETDMTDAMWYCVSNVTTADITAPTAKTPVTALNGDKSIQDVAVDAGQTIIVRVDMGMLESAGNTYQDSVFNADVTVSITQTNDKSKVVYVSTLDELNTALAMDNYPTIVFNKSITGNVTIYNIVNVDLNGYTLTGDVSFGNITTFGTIDIDGTVNGTVGAAPASVVVNN